MKIAPISNYEQYKLNNTNFKGTIVNNQDLKYLIQLSNVDGKIGFKNILQTIPKVNDGLVFEIKSTFYDNDEFGLGDGNSGTYYFLYKRSEQDSKPKLPILSIDSNNYPYNGYNIWLSIINDAIRAEYPQLFPPEVEIESKQEIEKLLAEV